MYRGTVTLLGVNSSPHRLSTEAHTRLSTELTDLSKRGRIDIANRIEQARLLGDLKENGDYHAAKEEQGKMEGRIRHLESMLGNCEILEQVALGEIPEIVTPGVVVELRFDGEADTVRFLFGSTEERPADGLDIVSPGSPLGKALVKARAGDVVRYTPGNGDAAVELSVEVVALGR